MLAEGLLTLTSLNHAGENIKKLFFPVWWVATGWSEPGAFLKMTIHDFVSSLTFCKFCCDGFARSLTADKSRQLTLAAAAGSLQPRARPAAPAHTAATIVTTIEQQ